MTPISWMSMVLILTAHSALSLGVPHNSTMPWVCEKLCACTLDRHLELYSANCSYRQLKEIPGNLTDGFHRLDFSRNRLKRVPAQGFIELKSLLYLDLSHNMISGMAESAFDGLSRLRELRLDNNLLQLRLNSSPFKPLIFSQLAQLRRLTLQLNSQECRDFCGYPDEALSHLKHLSQLSIDGMPYKDFGPGFQNLSHLNTLSLGNEEGNCSIPVITNTTFINFKQTNLTHLSILHCDINEIDPQGFSPLKNIHTLHMYRNHLTFSKLKTGLIGLSQSPIKVLSIIHTQKHPQYILPEKIFEPLKNTSLTDLIFRDNGVYSIEDKFLMYLPVSLENLDLSQNAMVRGRPDWLIYITRLINLRSFNGSYQANHDTSFQHRHTLTKETREITEVGAPKNLEYLYLQNSNFYIPHIQPLNFTQNKVKYIDFSGNVMKFQGPLYNLHKLEHVDLSNAQSDVLHRDFFTDMPSLETLLLNDNKLNCLSQDIEGETFRAVQNLKYLDLSKNGIEHLSAYMFKEQRQLETLKLHSNYLGQWKSLLEQTKNMTFLDLSKNRLTTLDEEARKDLDKVMTNPTFRINLLGNLLECHCDKLDFLKWLLKRKRFFIYLQNYECMFPSGRNTTLADLPSTIKQMESDCMSDVSGVSDTVLIAAAVSLATMLTIMFLAGFLYRYRWQVRYYKNRLALRLQLYQPLIEENDDDGVSYDAFLSYHSDQDDFIIHRVYPKLEQRHGFKLCIHSRDFIPGNPVAANIYRAVHASKLTIAFITEEYFKSQWCMYELKMAYLESVHTGQQLLMPVLMEQVDFTKLPSDIRKVFKYITYLEYSANEEDNFFQRLIETLQQ